MSPYQYEALSCSQIAAELSRVSRRAQEVGNSVNKTANKDEALLGAGLFLFWPTLLFLEGDNGASAQEYARLKGEFDALEQSAIQKNCGLRVQKSQMESIQHRRRESLKQKQADAALRVGTH